MKLTVTARLILGFGIILLCFALGTFFSIWIGENAKDRSEQLANKNMPLSLTAADMKLGAIQVQQWLTDVSATHNPDGYKDAKEAKEQFMTGLRKFEQEFKQSQNSKGLADLKILKQGIDDLYNTGDRMAQAYMTQGLEAGNAIMKDFDTSSANLAASLDPFIEAQSAEASTSAKDLQADLNTLKKTQLIILAFSLFTGITASVIITRSLRNQLGAEPSDVASAAAHIAQGQFDFAMPSSITKPHGVYKAMLQMRDQLRENFLHTAAREAEANRQALVASKAEAKATQALKDAEKAKKEGILLATQSLASIVSILTNKTSELSGNMHQLVQGSHDQHSRIAESSNSMGEMRATVREIAQSSSTAAHVANDARTCATEGALATRKVVEDISIAQNQTLSLKSDMATLGEQAKGIGHVLSVINDIADQTNLLALNAAIEAARAGEAGRGFAVVADEVRKLAEKTVIATQEVEQAIASLQAGTQKSIAAVDHTVSTIQNISERAEMAGDSLGRIVSLVDETAGQVSSIASAAEEQAAASEEISDALHTVAQITDTSVTHMNQASTTVEVLLQEVENIHNLINKMEESVV